MLLTSVLEYSAARAPSKTALVCGDLRVSFSELDAQSNQLAWALVELGVAPGDRVALCLENSLEAVVSFFGILKAGAAVLLINAATRGDKLVFELEDSGAKLLIAAGKTLDLLGDVSTVARGLRAVLSTSEAAGPSSWHQAVEAQPEAALPPRAAPDDLACLLYTSGSTGRPKGVMHSHRSLGSATRSIVQYLSVSPNDVVLTVLPLSFGYGLSQLLPTFAAGGTLVLERSFAFPQIALQRLANERATGFAVVPTIAMLLLQNDLSKFNLNALRYVTNAGAGLAPALLAELRAKLPHVAIVPMYGQTECIRASYMPPEEVARRPTSVGRGIPGQEQWLEDETGLRLPPGSTGELVVCGEHVMLGYWGQPEATAQKLRASERPGTRVLRTGDTFRQDEDGWLYFIARQDDIIKTRGEKVSPREVENVLQALDGVLSAAVVGIPDPLLGQVVKAYIVKRSGAPLDEKSIRRYCSRELEDYAIPKQIEFLEEMPKTPNAKIDKQALLQRHEAK